MFTFFFVVKLVLGLELFVHFKNKNDVVFSKKKNDTSYHKVKENDFFFGLK